MISGTLRLLRRRAGVLVAVGGLLLTTAGAVASAPRVATSAAPASTACGEPDQHRVRAGSGSAEPNQVSAAQVSSTNRALLSRQRGLPNTTKAKISNPSAKVTIKVYAHAITLQSRDRNGNYVGYVPASRITNQIKVLNTAYASSGFAFVLAGSDSTPNDDWYYWSEDFTDAPAKTRLFKGTVADLNLYFTAFEDSGLLGYATFPWDKEGKRDGVVMLNDSLPGGNATNYNLGDTVVHEVGHWLGLLHTFQDDCSVVNDAVKDTPAQKFGDNVYTCKVADTCPSTGSDPIHNYMSYGDDYCITSFTPGQGYRMRQIWYSYRAPKV